MTSPVGRPISELKVMDLESVDLTPPTLVRQQTHYSILSTLASAFIFVFPRSLMQGQFKLYNR